MLKLSKTSKILFSLLVSATLEATSLEDFYLQVHQQSLQKDYVTFRGRSLLSHEAYIEILKESEKERLQGSLVMIRGRIERFIYFNETGGVALSSDQNANLRFDIRYYETLKDIGIGGGFFAICVLPRYDKCLLLGYKAFD